MKTTAASLFISTLSIFFSLPIQGVWAGGQTELITPAFKSVSKAYDPKHTPKITAPKKVKAGEWFDVTIEIGHGERHPSLVEHHVRSITLLKNDVELVRAYLHPVQASPKVTFTVALEETATLRVLEEPTHSAAWESSVEVVVSQ
ncbi:MAG: desulfoferrodoxin family protein [Candidatus Binatia bacterium]